MDTLNSKKVEINIYTIVIFFRIWLGQYLGAWLPAEQIHDDALMVNYADLYSHYISKDLPEQINMVKEIYTRLESGRLYSQTTKNVL